MTKKSIFLFFLVLFLCSCTGIELKHLNPIPTQANDGGLLQLGKDVLRGNWERFKDNEKNEVAPMQENDFFTSPMQNEFGEEIPTDYFKAKSTEYFNIELCRIVEVVDDKVNFEFMFEIKNKNIKIEYVKVQSVIPNDVLTFIDETQKNKNLNSNIKVFTEIIKEKDIYAWHGMVSNMPHIIYNPEYLNRYLFKFTIKPIGKPETTIYQPCFLQVSIFNSKQ